MSLAATRKAVFETPDHILGSDTKPSEFTWKPLIGMVGNFIDRYVNLQGGGEVFLELRHNSVFRGEFNSQKCIFTFEKVGWENLSKVDCHAFREPIEEIIVDSLSYRCGDVQSSMSVLPRAIVQDCQSRCQPILKITDRFFNRIRLYSAEPVPQLLREWEFVDTCIIELLFPHVDRKFQAVCVGGRLASLGEPNGFPYQGIKSGAELIKILAEFERQQFVIGNSLKDGCNGPCPLIFLVKTDGIAVLWKDPENFIPKSFGMHFGAPDTLPTVFK